MVYVRKNQRNLTRAERKKFVAAVLELKRRGIYDQFVQTHIDHYTADGDHGVRVAHMGPSFLPWHRRFLLDFESALREVDGSVSVPYWDWTQDNTPASSLWHDDFMGGNGRREDLQVMTGPFAYSGGNWDVTVSASDGRFLTRDLGRPSQAIDLPTKAQLAWATADPVYDSAPWDSRSDKGFRNKLEGWAAGEGNERFLNHNRVHRWVSGLMLGGGSVNDPVFWLHHSFVDAVWSRWQQAHPSAVYMPEGTDASSSAFGSRVVGRDEPMPPWGDSPSSMWDHSKIYRYAT
ncbi:tyrosinase family protein [Streptomyces sp. NPDC050738]|uniref:tyrosinase family protein n=1 Tax=Streptomyces sp. NPDC050738 TaxID=3154744 RepID=UPI0034454C0B